MTGKQMMDDVMGKAQANGHRMYQWTKGRWGFVTNCANCGATVAITVSTLTQREGDRLLLPCEHQSA